MRRFPAGIIPIFSAALLSLVFAGCVKKEISNIDSKGKNIICFGDSITCGYGVNKGEDYPTALAELLNRPVVNMGVEGETSADGLKRLKTDVLDKEPLLVIVEFGGNDFLSKTPQDVTMRNIKEMVRRIRESGAMVAIADVSAGMFLADYRRDLSKLSREEGAIFIPAVLSGIITNPSMKSDFFHPNRLGYGLIARQVYRAIKPCLDRNACLNKAKKIE